MYLDDPIKHLSEDEQDVWIDRAHDLEDRQMLKMERALALQEEEESEEWERNSWNDLEDEVSEYPKITLSHRARRRLRMSYHLARRKYNLVGIPKI